MTSLTALPTTASTTQTRRLRRLALAGVAALLVVLGVAAAAPANAATGSGSVTVCFVQTTGAPWRYETYSQYWNGSAWVKGASAAGTSNGCRTWSAAAGSSIRFYVSHVFPAGMHGSTFASNYTNWVTTSAGSSSNLGSNTVYQTAKW